MPLTTDEKNKIMKKYQQNKGDTGSPEVQVGLLSKRIKNLQGHLEEHGHDAPAKLALLSLVAKRRRLLRYLASRDQERYESLIDKVGLKK
jgi:small subunit ribosomal protein S15